MAKARLFLRIAALFGAAVFVPGSIGSTAAAPTPYWLQFGKPARTCPSGETPFKVQGASWGVIASGIAVCRRTSTSYIYTLLFINVFIDPTDKQSITRDVLNFDWCGLALYRPNPAGDEIEWRYEKAVPIKGALRKDATGKIVFGNVSFEVPREDADAATNMLFYMTFQGPLVVIGAV